MRVKRLQATALMAALVLAGCGARLTPEQLKAAGTGVAANGQPTGSTAVNAGDASAPGADTTASGATAAGADTGGATAQSGANGATAPDAGGAQQAAAGSTAAPAGGNGGATDIGVTADSITLGNVATLSGPVPGLFQGAVIGTQAALAYQNSLGGVFGRKLKLDVRDDQFDSGQNRAQTIDLLGKSFAMVGSFSTYDGVAADQIKASNIPDVSYSLSAARRSIPNNFSIEPSPPHGAPTGVFVYFKNKYPDAVKSVGTLHGDDPTSAASQADYVAAAQSVGWNFAYDRAVGPTETDFTADVVRMKAQGVKMIFLVSAQAAQITRLAKAMHDQGFNPQPFVVNGPAYDGTLIPSGGANVEGIIDSQPYSLFLGEDSAAIPEVALMNQWMQKVKPGYKPDLFALFGWASGRLFIQALQAAGPKATRAAVMDQLEKIDDFSDNGAVAPAGPASKRPPTCRVMAVVHNGKWERYDSPPSDYICNEGPFWTPK